MDQASIQYGGLFEWAGTQWLSVPHGAYIKSIIDIDDSGFSGKRANPRCISPTARRCSWNGDSSNAMALIRKLNWHARGQLSRVVVGYQRHQITSQRRSSTYACTHLIECGSGHGTDWCHPNEGASTYRYGKEWIGRKGDERGRLYW